MSGPSYAPILIPIAGTVFLIAWLLLVFHAGRHLDGTSAAARRPGRRKLVRPAAGPGRPAAWPSAPAGNVIQAAAAFRPGQDAGAER
jgi:hypothetical protein